MNMASGERHGGQLAPFLPPGKTIMPYYIMIKWLVPYLPAGRTITLSYTITNPMNVGLLPLIQNLLVVQSTPAPIGMLRVVSMQTPTFYTNSTNRITVGVLYTGTSEQKVEFILSTTSGATIINPVQFVNATPNQLLQEAFVVRSENVTGTEMFDLSIATSNATVSYTVPVIVLEKPSAAVISTTIPQTAISGAIILKYSSLALGIAVLVIIVIIVRGARKKPRYEAERAKELIRIREQIKRGDELV